MLIQTRSQVEGGVLAWIVIITWHYVPCAQVVNLIVELGVGYFEGCLHRRFRLPLHLIPHALEAAIDFHNIIYHVAKAHLLLAEGHLFHLRFVEHVTMVENLVYLSKVLFQNPPALWKGLNIISMGVAKLSKHLDVRS